LRNIILSSSNNITAPASNSNSAMSYSTCFGSLCGVSFLEQGTILVIGGGMQFPSSNVRGPLGISVCDADPFRNVFDATGVAYEEEILSPHTGQTQQNIDVLYSPNSAETC
jgi:hypothetical protein